MPEYQVEDYRKVVEQMFVKGSILGVCTDMPISWKDTIRYRTKEMEKSNE